jgi:hypothetical protein
MFLSQHLLLNPCWPTRVDAVVTTINAMAKLMRSPVTIEGEATGRITLLSNRHGPKLKILPVYTSTRSKHIALISGAVRTGHAGAIAQIFNRHNLLLRFQRDAIAGTAGSDFSREQVAAVHDDIRVFEMLEKFLPKVKRRKVLTRDRISHDQEAGKYCLPEHVGQNTKPVQHAGRIRP